MPDRDMNTKWEKVGKFQKQKKNQTINRSQKLANKSIKCGDKALHTVKLSEEEIMNNWQVLPECSLALKEKESFLLNLKTLHCGSLKYSS